MESKWYVFQVRPNTETKAAQFIKTNLQACNIGNNLIDCQIPLQKVWVLRNGKKESVNKKIYPGYIMLHIKLDEDFSFVFNIILGVKDVRKSLGTISSDEVSAMLQQVEKGKDVQEDVQMFSVGDTVMVHDGGVNGGGFDGFSGAIQKIDRDKKIVTITISILGRETTVDLAFAQVRIAN
jgi:transcriptional antiterminator NusG